MLTTLHSPVGSVGRKLRAQPVFDAKRPEEISIWVSVKHAALAYASHLQACSPVERLQKYGQIA